VPGTNKNVPICPHPLRGDGERGTLNVLGRDVRSVPGTDARRHRRRTHAKTERQEPSDKKPSDTVSA
jgi:hypothetical protein